MHRKEPKFMQDLHKIREQISKECKGKSIQEVLSSSRKLSSRLSKNQK